MGDEILAIVAGIICGSIAGILASWLILLWMAGRDRPLEHRAPEHIITIMGPGAAQLTPQRWPRLEDGSGKVGRLAPSHRRKSA